MSHKDVSSLCPHCGERVAIVAVSESSNPGPKTSHKKKFKRSQIQTLIFPKSQWTVARARSWLREHDYKAGKVEVKDDMFRFRQQERQCDDFAIKTLKREPEIQALICLTNKVPPPDDS